MPKFQRCLVMAGGGFRLGYYLGIYAALRQLNKTPDLLLACCGGAIAATIIKSLPDDAQRKAWLASPEMHQFWRSLRANPHASMTDALRASLRRRLATGDVKKIPDLFADYLFEVPAEIPLPAVTDHVRDSEVAVAIIAGRLLYAQDEVGSKRGHRPLFAETVFCPPQIASMLEGMQSPMHAANFAGSVVDIALQTDSAMPMMDAARASVSDMFYFRCHSRNDVHYVGGVVDLFPIEIAKRLADNVVMEIKSQYDQSFSLPAIKVVLGFDGNERLNHVLRQQVEMWIDTSDMEKVLAKHQVQKKIKLLRNTIELAVPQRYADYQAAVEAQWQYGYQRTMQGAA